MSDLNPEQLAELAQMLEAREQSLRSAAQEHTGRLRSIDSPGITAPPGDLVDHAEAEIERGTENSLVERTLRELKDIELVKARIASGEAGVCVQCGEDIGFERLRVQPTALRCLECQELAENPLLNNPNGAASVEGGDMPSASSSGRGH